VATAAEPYPTTPLRGLTEAQILRPGDRLDQPTFHRLYLASPEGFKAELIGGIVMVPFGASLGHAGDHSLLGGLFFVYSASTPGTRSLTEPTVILGPDSEPQPDCVLIVAPEHGGRCRLRDDYLTGPPELVAEVSYSSRAYDLHGKKRDYEAAGVAEYLLLIRHPPELRGFVLRDGAYEPRPADADGLYRSASFPGLWLDPVALVAGDIPRALAALQLGLAAPEHADFVARLAAARPPAEPA